MRISDWSSDVCSSDLVDSTAGVQQRLEERPFPQFWDLKIDLAGLGRERLRACPVAARAPLRRPLMKRSTDLARHFRVDQNLKARLQPQPDNGRVRALGLTQNLTGKGLHRRPGRGHCR